MTLLKWKFLLVNLTACLSSISLCIPVRALHPEWLIVTRFLCKCNWLTTPTVLRKLRPSLIKYLVPANNTLVHWKTTGYKVLLPTVVEHRFRPGHKHPVYNTLAREVPLVVAQQLPPEELPGSAPLSAPKIWDIPPCFI